MEILEFLESQFSPKIVGNSAQMICPFHNDHPPGHLYMYLTTGHWKCFHSSCLETGSFRRFLQKLNLPSSIEKEIDLEKIERRSSPAFSKYEVLPEHALAPYTKYIPRYLIDSGFSFNLLKKKQIGYDEIACRAIFPIRDHQGRLVGMSGRLIVDDINIREQRYKFYINELYPSCPKYSFKSGNFLYNIDQVYPQMMFREKTGENYVIVVEGFKACLWLLDKGFSNVVALMGSSLSKQQEEMLSYLTNDYILFLDNDEGGNRGTEKISRRLIRHGKVSIIQGNKKQPDNYSEEELKKLFETKTPYLKYLKKGEYK